MGFIAGRGGGRRRGDGRGRGRIGALIVPLAIGLAWPGASALADEYGSISGRVTDAVTHEPLAGIEVCAFTTANLETLSEAEFEHAFGCVRTPASGEYTVSELRPESYVVGFSVPIDSSLNYIFQYFNAKLPPAEPTAVTVTAGHTTTAIDAQLQHGGQISGRVTDAPTGAPLEKALVCALAPEAEGSLTAVSCAITNANGEYTISGLPAGSYKIGFLAKGHAIMYYNGRSSLAEAESVSVAALALVQGINAALSPGSLSSTTTGSTPAGGGVAGTQAPGATTHPAGSLAGLSIAVRRLVVRPGGSARVRVGCSGTAACRGKLELLLKRTVKVKGRSVARTVLIGSSARVSIAAGGHAMVKLVLGALGRRLLRADHGRLAANLELVAATRTSNNGVVLEVQRPRH
jgi:hypothetical protein